ncbi:hypothetical protein ACFRKB_17410 [Streptomyces scopuliridis]|uniref:hypothetical protein n=1 Tax=Streptomyces scopuliridis TaxID=452529 RepID=UPI0036C8D6A5
MIVHKIISPKRAGAAPVGRPAASSAKPTAGAKKPSATPSRGHAARPVGGR